MPGMWLSEAALWMEGWVHRGSFKATVRSENIRLIPDAFMQALRGTGSRRTATYFSHYAAHFLRLHGSLCEAVIAASDIWGDRSELAGVAFNAVSLAAGARRGRAPIPPA